MMERNSQACPLLSIVIPTRNRQPYAISAIKSILSIPSNELELVVQDNSDSDNLSHCMGEQINDARLRYNYSPSPLSCVDNFNAGAALATGEYVTFIGDDDGVNPEIMTAVRWARDQDLDALTPRIVAYYSWPDMDSRYYGKRHAGMLYLWKFTGRRTYPRMEEEMRKCAHSAGQSFFALPKPYTGIVRRACFTQVRESAGIYFGGASPDIFGALALASFVRKSCVLDYPLILPGGSGKSTAGDSARGQHKGRLEDIPHLSPQVVQEWPEIIPRFYGVQTVWAQAAVAALKATGRTDILQEFNVPLLHALCAGMHREYLPLIMDNYWRQMAALGVGRAGAGFLFLRGAIQAAGQYAERILPRLLHPTPAHGALISGPFVNIEEAVEQLTRELRHAGASIAEVLAVKDQHSKLD